MSWRDRPYSNGDDAGGFPGSGQGMGFALPRPTPVVKYLLIINVVVFLLTVVPSVGNLFLSAFSMTCYGGVFSGQIWRLVTYQYLHDTNSGFHLLFNMIGLYFLGPPMEQRWGSKTFFSFYTACGVAGALLYTFLVGVHFMGDAPMIGASGSVLGLLAACAVLMPQMIIILLFFPVPIRLAAVLLTAIYVLNLVTSFGRGATGAGGDAAHLGGMAFGAVWCLWGWGWLGRIREQRQRGTWEKKLQRENDLEAEVDRILAKVHDQGIQSLSRREKQILAEATEAQNKRERRTRHP
ncbi:MAG: rhomboid family intramembrane serine protease [Phycisphaerae bacterium]|nr:rhomboid family intramembrane serine protease [Phycisphaerae bacterium]